MSRACATASSRRSRVERSRGQRPQVELAYEGHLRDSFWHSAPRPSLPRQRSRPFAKSELLLCPYTTADPSKAADPLRRSETSNRVKMARGDDTQMTVAGPPTSAGPGTKQERLAASKEPS